MKLCLALSCAIAFALPSNAQSPVDGKWKSYFVGMQDEPILVVFELKSAGNSVAGTVTSWRGSEQLHQIAVQNGNIRGNALTFETSYIVPFLSNRFGWRELTTRLRSWGAPSNANSGIIKNDNISFTQHDWRGETIVFQATRKK